MLFLIMIFFSCEEVFIDADPKNDPLVNFDFLWSELDQKYSFFDFKKIDWDSVYNVYRPQVNSSTPREELFNVMANMMNTLRDGHVNLRSEFNISKYENWFLDYPANFERELILYYYLGNDYKITGPLLHKEIRGLDMYGMVRFSPSLMKMIWIMFSRRIKIRKALLSTFVAMRVVIPQMVSKY